MSYSVGNLYLALTGIDRSASKSIDNVIKKLNQLNSALSVFSKVNLTGINSLAVQLDHFSWLTKGLDFKSVSTFSNALNKINSVNFNSVASGFNKLAVAITPFLDKVNSAKDSLVALYNVLEKGGSKKINNLLDDSGNKGKGGIGSLFNVAKITSTIYLTRRLAHTVGGVIQKGSEYTETLNLWQVAMRDNLDLADKFITKMNKAYGISEKTLMNAQAVFKNMIGSLGQVSDQTAYLLSETLIQMSVDFASLYNTTLQQAFSKIQAMLAGQVRPIRSAGLDMTETTLFMYYQQMGGTKTMRQLNRTEKQLLSIYAVFEQMGKAGALGDMTKTLNTFANQTRITAESWEELMTWTGVVVKHLIQESGLITNINAVLITMGEIMKAVANSMGAMEEDWSGALFENVTDTNNALDEMQGKLLDFDKFRSLQGQGENFLGIDEKLLQAITGYDSLIEKANNKAREQAEIWLENLGFVDKNGDGIYDITEKAEDFLFTLKMIGNTLALIAIYFTGKTLVNGVIALSAAFGGFKNMLMGVTAGVGAFINGWLIAYAILRQFPEDAQKVVGAIMAIAGAITALTMAVLAKNAVMSWGTALPILMGALGVAVAGGMALAGKVESVAKYADGGMPEKGSMFVAGEAGAEIVYNAPSGQSGVANIKQIEQAMYGALVAYGRTQGSSNNSSRPIEVYVDGERMFTTMGNVANRHGVGFARK